MERRSLLVLALVVGALAAFIWFFERDLPSSDERRELASKLLPIASDDVRSISIEKDGRRVRLERRVAEPPGAFVSEWRLVEPLDAAADAAAIADLLAQLTSLTRERLLDQVEASAVGLESPRLRIGLETDRKTWQVALGAEVPATENAVVGVEGEGVFVTSERFLDLVPERPAEWRSRDALTFDESGIERIVVSTPGSELAIRRDGGRFALESPIQDVANPDKVEALLGEIEALSVSEFVDEPDEAQQEALRTPAYRIALQPAGGESIELELARQAEEPALWLARLAGRVFVAESEMAARLDGSVDDWRSRRWTQARTFEVESVRLAISDRALELARREGSWFSDDATIPYTTVTDLLDLLTGLEGEAFEDRASWSGVEEVGRVDLDTSDGTESLTVVSLGESAYRAVSSDRDEALVLDKDLVNDLIAAIEEVEQAAASSAPVEGE